MAYNLPRINAGVMPMRQVKYCRYTRMKWFGFLKRLSFYRTHGLSIWRGTRGVWAKVYRDLYKKNLCTKNCITGDDLNSLKLESNRIIFSWGGLGDQVLLADVAKTYYEYTGKKLLLVVDHPIFFAQADYCWILADYAVSDLVDLVAEGVKKPNEHPVIEVAGRELELFFLDHSPWIERKGTECWVQAFSNKHIAQTMLENLGLEGRVQLRRGVESSEAEREALVRKFPALVRGAHDKPRVCVMTGGRFAYKTYPTDRLQAVIDALHEEFDFIQVGRLADDALTHVQDFREKLTMREILCLFEMSDLFVGSIGGLMHLSYSAGTPSVVTYSAEPERLVGYHTNLNVSAEAGCTVCNVEECSPIFEACPRKPAYQCIRSISPEAVIRAVRKGVKQSFEEEVFDLKSDPKNCWKNIVHSFRRPKLPKGGH